MESEGLSEAQIDRNFQEMFGISQAEVIAQGGDVDEYIRQHIGDRSVEKRSRERSAREYALAADRLAGGRSLLPYRAPSAWISSGPTMRSNWHLGSVEIDRGHIRLSQTTSDPVVFVPSAVSVHRVRIWPGTGVRLSSGSVNWYVQPLYSQNPFRAHKATVVFRAALREAGVR